LVVKTPGIPQNLVTVPYTTATNIFFANLHRFSPHAKTIGITGSKGKSTTASLIHAILVAAGKKSHLIGNIGRPMLEELLCPVGEDDWFVLELSSYQLEDVKFGPDIAVFLTFFPEHLNYHGTLEAYFNGKARITLTQTENNLFIYHPGDSRITELVNQTRARTLPCIPTIPFSTDHIQLIGEHNKNHIRAALTVTQELGISNEVAQQAIEAFEPLPHRMQLVGIFHGITFYDDAIACAPDAVMIGIQTLKDVDTIFLGGQDRGLDYTQMADVVANSTIRNIVLFPETGKRMIEMISEKCTRPLNHLETNSMEEAVKFAYANTEKGKICLLATGAPSYTLWKDFEQKGDEFQRWVKEMGNVPKK
ncbi:MAG: UDP-N-acetylmuramoyl-L-alanine--D-glutamate ligase, partial [Patescibacteria group bacterium]